MSSSAEASSIAMAAGSVRDSNFYLGFAIVSAVMVFTGFSRSFYLKPYFNTPRLPLLFQVHGSVFTLWVLFFVAQAWLAWDGRFNLHRQRDWARDGRSPPEVWRVSSQGQFDGDDRAIFHCLVILFQPASHFAGLDSYHRVISGCVPMRPVEDLCADRALLQQFQMSFQLVPYDIL